MHPRLHGCRQRDFAFKSWGGARLGAGRRPDRPRARASHGARPQHDARYPLHLTVRLRDGLPSLRRKEARDAIAGAFATGHDRFGFCLTQFSLQSNHVHLIAEAEDRRALSRGMQA